MKTAFAVIVLTMVFFFAAGCYAQSESRFQSVGGDYGQSWISSFKANNPQPTEESSSGSSNGSGSGSGGNLWSWGSAPKGSMVVDGQLIVDPTYVLRNLTVTRNWLGETDSSNPTYTYTDPKTGNQIYTYTDPNTGQTYYTYKDPNTNKQVNVYIDPYTGQPTHASFAPITSPNTVTGGVLLPPIFNSNNPWA
jgi:hypothetical protein